MPGTGQFPQRMKQPDVYVSFSSEITPQPTEALIATLANLANQNTTRVHLLLSTVGGSVKDGITLYNTLRAFPFELITHNVGCVNSIGNAVFLAGDKRYACPHSTFMFHGVGFDLNGTIRLEEKLLLEKLEALRADQKLIADVIADRTKLGADEISRLFLEAQTKDADWAVGAGLIDEIRDVDIPAGHPVQSLVFQRQSVAAA
jgi:ATP-dependent Clp protease, protease subunit